jgi:hypothetical protein
MQSQHLLGIYNPIFRCNSTCIIFQMSLKVQNSIFQVGLQHSENISIKKKSSSSSTHLEMSTFSL